MKGQQRVEVDRLKRKAMRGSSGARLNGLSDNEMAARLRGSGDSFLASAEWKELRRLMVEKHGAKCMCCGFVPKHPWQINVDHVKPRRFYPELALDEGNLQVLCARCNKAKGNKVTDYRTLPDLA